MKKQLLIAGFALTSAAALAIGGGTFASFTDSEITPAQSVAAGTLDIEFTNTNLTNNAIGSPLSVVNAQPGSTAPTQYLYVKNSGSLPVSIDMNIRKLSDADNSCTEPEGVAEAGCDPAGGGELDSVMSLNLDGYVNVGDVLNGLAVNGVALANGPLQSGADSTFTLAVGAEKIIAVDYNIPLSAGNQIQTDSVSFQVEFEAVQINLVP